MAMAKSNIFEQTVAHFLSPIRDFMEDPTVSEIMINNPREIYIEKSGQLVRTEAKFADDEALLAAVKNVLQYTGKRLTDERPLMDSRLPDGSRVHVILPPLCRTGIAMTIRKFAKALFHADHLVEMGACGAEAMEYLKMCVQAEKNLLVAGGTSSGKTVLLNALSEFLPAHQRIVVIEDSSELELQQDHVITLETRSPDRWGRGEVTIGDLFQSALRLRPDRVIIGEVRGGEALDMIQAMTSGHAGSMSTLHASSARDALNRLETLAMMNKVELPLHALRAQVSSAVDAIVLTTRFNDGRRALTQICEVLPLGEDGRYRLQDMFLYELSKGEAGKTGGGGMVWTGKTSSFAAEPKMRVLRNHWDLTKKIFQAEGEAAP